MSYEPGEPGRKRSPFTATQAAVVLTIVMVLVAGGVVGVKQTRLRSRKAECKESLKRIGVYFQAYASKYAAYPTIGADTWFGLLWRTGIASDGSVFRCAVVGKAGSGTHYRRIMDSGSYAPGCSYSWTTASGISDASPPDLPMACDDDRDGIPNHGPNSDRNVLFFQGRIDVFEIGSPTEGAVNNLLNSSTWAAPAGR